MTLLTPTRVRELLRTHGLAPSKRLGQNFVVDANVVRKVARDAGVAPGEGVVEIGPGLGSLTLALREAGAVVLAVEVDAGMVRALGEVVGGDPGVTVVHADALHADWAALTAGLPPRSVDRIVAHPRSSDCGPPPALVANLPYNVATPIVLHALESGVFGRLLVMVQREVGERWAAGPRSERYGAVSVKVAGLAAAAVVAAVPRGAFWPVPNVDSVTVRLVPRPWPHDVARDVVVGLVDGGFAQRRKRLRNALGVTGRAPAAVEAALAAAGLDPGARAEELGLAQWVALARHLDD